MKSFQEIRVVHADVIARVLISTVLMAAFALQAWQQYRRIQVGTQGYLIGDWLISYAGGFVRRGLVGEVLLSLGDDSGEVLALLFTLQLLLYFVIFGTLIYWVLVLEMPRRWTPLLLSPAFLVTFGFNDFGGTHRKEILAFAGLFILAEAVRSSRRVRLALVLSMLLFVVAVFSHEPSALLVIPFIIFVRTAKRDGQISASFARRSYLLLIATFGAGVALSIAFSGTFAQQLRICGELVSRGFDEAICTGAISFIGLGISDEAVRVLNRMPGYLLFGLPAALATVPFMLVPWARSNWRLLFLAVTPLAPLLLVTDWGRWLMWAATVATVLTVVHASRSKQIPRNLSMPLLVGFVTLWSMPHWAAGTPYIGPARIWRLPRYLLDAFAAILG